ncbi:MAG: hypothetical protein A2589_00580 [Candidatus Vogelbacteria bacterium RIFOXYD1_FULL_46_19]|uniref:UPF0102 protein A2589_00580 n=1 Tax=Candidatus Vogelbacteria bacterium RIFOXYD1_FULL_46_19 TaxID=1802439 RepID=A0A1G2QJB2_9BACT|nr:MAG: hypothetical protein A2589_00580 [Candidatus Vogelbacteria bacterium RIFOXYD1_FULL_46_19]
MTAKARLGALGEQVAAKYLKQAGFKVVAQNYRKPWGEIDLVATKGGNLHFVEVKTVTKAENVLHETGEQGDDYEPADNIHPWKLKRLARAMESFMLDQNIPEEVDYQLDAILVYLSPKEQVLKIEYLPDIF